jgi:hypothetical protein
MWCVISNLKHSVKRTFRCRLRGKNESLHRVSKTRGGIPIVRNLGDQLKVKYFVPSPTPFGDGFKFDGRRTRADKQDRQDGSVFSAR